MIPSEFQDEEIGTPEEDVEFARQTVVGLHNGMRGKHSEEIIQLYQAEQIRNLAREMARVADAISFMDE